MSQADQLLEALSRGRDDHQFFSHFFLKRKLHDGQLELVENGNATINVLSTANRWGKTFSLDHIHFHANIFKTGAEPRYIKPAGIDMADFVKVKYHTVHTADLWETAALVWDDAHKLLGESAPLRALVKDAPRTRPPHIDFIFGSRWKFRTLGDNAEGIDGNSFYVITIDEAGWINDLETKMNNVIRVRVADVSGRIFIVGTFKPGVSRDFYKYATRASARTGRGMSFAHGGVDDDDAELEDGSKMDKAIRKYLREFFKRERARGHTINQETLDGLARIGVTADELADAIGGR